MAVYKRFGSDVEHDMPARFEITKGVLCMLMEIDDEEFVYILDSDGNTVSTMLTSSSTFTPPADGNYIVKTNSDLNNAAGTDLNPLEFMWRGMRHLNRFPLNLSTVNTYMLAQIMKKMNYKSFVKASSTCKGLRDIPKEHPKHFSFEIPFYFHIGILNEGGGISGLLSTHFEDCWSRPYPRAKSDEDYEIRLSELEHYQPFCFPCLKIDQPFREDFLADPRMEELENISKTIVESKLHFKQLLVERCTMQEVLVLLGGIRPKQACIRMCSFDQRHVGPTLIYDRAMNRFHSVVEDFGFTLPEELVIVSPNFHYINQFPGGKSISSLVSQVRFFLAVALSDDQDHHETACNFIDEFAINKDLGQNKVTIFVMRSGRIDFLSHFHRRRPHSELRFGKQTRFIKRDPGDITVNQCCIGNDAKKIIFVESRAYNTFCTYSFAEFNGNLDTSKRMVDEAHLNLDDRFVDVYNRQDV